MIRVLPTLDLERAVWASRPGIRIAGVDEVGRGALAGPVSVGAAIVDESVGEAPAGLADSKLLRPAARAALVEPIRAWVRGAAVGHAQPAEVDAIGIIGALRLAGTRALGHLADAGLAPDVVLLDGTHDWLTAPQAEPDLAMVPAAARVGSAAATDRGGELQWRVRTVRKGDATCASVAAASVLAKVARDALLTALDDPGYGYAAHKGYGTPAHREAIRRLGPGEAHRRSWRLPERLGGKA